MSTYPFVTCLRPDDQIIAKITNDFNPDWLLEFYNIANSDLLRSLSHQYTDSTYNCVVFNECNNPLEIDSAEVLLSRLVGCSPDDKLRMFTLECFHLQSCIYAMVSFYAIISRWMVHLIQNSYHLNCLL